MIKKELLVKHKIFILIVCCLVFILTVIGIFAIYQHRLSNSFHTILTNKLKTNMQEQREHANSTVSDIQKLMRMLADRESKMTTDGWELVIRNASIHMDYLSARQVADMCAAESSDYKKTLSRQLAAGEDVITDLGDPVFTDDSSSFAILHPVIENGNMTGLLRSRIDASMITGGNASSVSLFQKVYTVVTTSDGNVIYANTSYPDGQNLFSSAINGGIEYDEVQALQQSFKESKSKTISFKGKGNDYYMSWESLNFNGWRIVRFARSPDVILQTETILKEMIFTGVCLIVLTVIFGGFLIRLMLRQKRQMEMQQKRYDALAQFNDTLLFEYDVAANRIMLTPNAIERLDLKAGFMEGVPGEYYIQHLIHPDDAENIRKAFRPADILLDETDYLEARFRCRDGEYHWFGCQFKSIENSMEGARRIVGKLVDISDQHGREQTLRQAALVDSLTGIYNRSVEAIINEQLEKAYAVFSL